MIQSQLLVARTGTHFVLLLRIYLLTSHSNQQKRCIQISTSKAISLAGGLQLQGGTAPSKPLSSSSQAVSQYMPLDIPHTPAKASLKNHRHEIKINYLLSSPTLGHR